MYEIWEPPSSIFYLERLVGPSLTGAAGVRVVLYVVGGRRLRGVGARCSRSLATTSSCVSVLFVLTISKIERLNANVLHCVKKWDTLQFCGSVSKTKRIADHVQ